MSYLLSILIAAPILAALGTQVLPAAARAEPVPAHSLSAADSLRGELAAALSAEHYDRASELSSAEIALRKELLGPNHPDVGRSVLLQAEVATGLGDYTRAATLAERALAIVDTPENDSRLVDAMDAHSTIAVALHWHGDLLAAEQHYQQGLVLATDQRGERSPERALFLNDLGTLFLDLGDSGRAEELLMEALDLRREHASVRPLVETLVNLSVFHFYEYQPERALEFAEEAMRRLEDDGLAKTPLAARVHRQAGGASFDLENHEKSLEHFQASLRILEDVYPNGHLEIVHSLKGAADSLTRLKRYEESFALGSRAYEICVDLMGETHPEVVYVAKGLGDQQWVRSDFEAALPWYRRAAAGFEMTTGLVAWNESSQTPFAELAVCLLETGNELEAWPFVERDLARRLLAALRDAEWTPLTREQTQETTRLQHELDRASAILQQARIENGPRSMETRAARQAFEASRLRWIEHRNAVSEELEPGRFEPLPLLEIQAQLEIDEAIVGWVSVDPGTRIGRAFAYVIRPEGEVRWVRIHAGSDGPVLDKRLSESLQTGARQDSLDELTRELWDERIAPIWPLLEDCERVTFIPSTDLRRVPLELAEAPDGQFLWEKLDLSYAPSASVLAWQRAHRDSDWEPSTSAVLVFADPDFRGEASESRAVPEDVVERLLEGDQSRLGALPRLRNSASEAHSILNAFERVETHMHGEATESSFREALRDRGPFGIVHVATHAFVDVERPERSVLAFSPEQDGAGLLSVGELLRTVEVPTELLVLAACNTGTGDWLPGEGYLGFSSAFLQKGARRLLVSLWPVNDRSAAIFMDRFYAALAADESLLDALRRARSAVRAFVDPITGRSFDHPAYWAPFVLVGD